MMARWMMLAVLVAFSSVANADFRTGNVDVTNNLTVGGTAVISSNLTVNSGVAITDPGIGGLRVTHGPYGDTLFVEGHFPMRYVDYKTQVDPSAAVRFDANLLLSALWGGGNLYVEGTATVAGATVLTTATGVGTNDTRYLAALTNESDTLATVLGRGNNAAGLNATNYGNIQGTGVLIIGNMRVGDTVAPGGANILPVGSSYIRLLDSKTNTVLLGGTSFRSISGTNGIANLDFSDDVEITTNLTATGTITAGGGFYGSAAGLTNFPPSLIQTNDARYLAALTNEADTLATVLGRGNNAAGLSATNFGGIASTGVVNCASKAGLTNSTSRLTLADKLFENLDGGTFIGRDNVTRKRELANVGAAWTAKDSSRDWYSVSIASEGKYQAAVENGGQIYVSSDYGQTWTATESNRIWSSVSISSDGKYQTALVFGGQIYVSGDYGQTWTAKDSSRGWQSVSISSDGKYQTAVVYNGQIYVSIDYGQTWAAKDSSRSWSSVSISSDGKYQTAVVSGGQIYVSIDYGQTWAAKDSSRDWRSVSISSDGKYQTALVYGGQIYVSIDYGHTWAAKDSSRDWLSVSISSDGKYQTAVVYPGQIYVSGDYGQTWAAKDSSRSWLSVSISSDGKYQTAVAISGQIYVSVADEVVNGSLVVTNGSITAGGGFYTPKALTASNIVQTSGGWDDLLFPVNTIYAAGLTDIEYLPQSNSITFKSTCNTNLASDNVWIVGQLSHSTKTNSAFVSPHIHFVQTSATQTNMFFMRYKRYKVGEAVPTTWTDIPCTNNVIAYTSGTIHQITEGANIAGPFGISENFDFKIWSRGGEAVQLKFFDIHFQRDSLGSDQEYTKTF